jgi:hypothetical protein
MLENTLRIEDGYLIDLVTTSLESSARRGYFETYRTM